MAPRTFRAAIAGATGLVGTTFRQILEERDFPMSALSLFASDRSEGRELPFRGGNIRVEDLAKADFAGFDFVFGATEAGIAREYVPRAAAAGAIVIDNSSAYRMEPDIPLVVPEVNPEDARGHAKVIANPWQIAVGADFAYAETTGPKPVGTDLVNRYMSRVLRAAQVSPEVNTAMIMVQNLLEPPSSLLKPSMVRKVRRASRELARHRTTGLRRAAVAAAANA